MMSFTLAFDVYGTLVDTSGVVDALRTFAGDKARDFSDTWRNKQLEYSFRRGLMRDYVDFATCTRQALDYTCEYFSLELTEKQRTDLMNVYKRLPVFSDVCESLTRLTQNQFRLYAFSNGSAHAVDELLVTAGIRESFLGIVSVEGVQSFKPDPAVYQYFLEQSGATARDVWLISGNPFDVLGAMNAGMNAAWLKRQEKVVFDPWDMRPALEIKSLSGLCAQLMDRLPDNG